MRTTRPPEPTFEQLHAEHPVCPACRGTITAARLGFAGVCHGCEESGHETLVPRSAPRRVR